MSNIKIVLGALIGLLVGWTGYTLYAYFFDTIPPVVILSGIEEGGVYAGDVQCLLSGSDEYKVADVSIWIDQKPLVLHHVINKREFEYVFSIATKALTDGKHALKITVQDASFTKNSSTKEYQFMVDNLPLKAVFVVPDALYKVFQGRTLHVQFQANKLLKEAYIETLSQRYPCVQESENSTVYECFVPISSDENPSEHLFTMYAVDSVGNVFPLTSKFQVVLYPFKKQFIPARDKAKQEEIGLSEKQFIEDVARISRESSTKKKWQSVFYVPCEMTGISTAFGTLRTSQERGRYRHDAIDLLGAPKSIIWASQDGVIVLKERYIHCGKCIGIDHGCGVITLYFHLDDFEPNIKVGDVIKKGKPLGTLGMTGYATGYHLHWELRVRNVPVDPMQWTTYEF